MCDGTVDCPEGDDEGARCNDDECSDDNGGCSYYCYDSPHGAWCVCETGYAVSKDDMKVCYYIHYFCVHVISFM